VQALSFKQTHDTVKNSFHFQFLQIQTMNFKNMIKHWILPC